MVPILLAQREVSFFRRFDQLLECCAHIKTIWFWGDWRSHFHPPKKNIAFVRFDSPFLIFAHMQTDAIFQCPRASISSFGQNSSCFFQEIWFAVPAFCAQEKYLLFKCPTAASLLFGGNKFLLPRDSTSFVIFALMQKDVMFECPIVLICLPKRRFVFQEIWSTPWFWRTCKTNLILRWPTLPFFHR